MYEIGCHSAHRARHSSSRRLRSRALRGYQAAYLLIRRGLCVESMAVMRVVMECVILIVKLRADPSYAEVLKREQERHRITQAKKIVAFREQLSEEIGAKMD